MLNYRGCKLGIFVASIRGMINTRDDIVVECPRDLRWRDASDAAGQQETLSLVESHIPQELREGWMCVDGQTNGATVLPN